VVVVTQAAPALPTATPMPTPLTAEEPSVPVPREVVTGEEGKMEEVR
jgi:hypothetical protein